MATVLDDIVLVLITDLEQSFCKGPETVIVLGFLTHIVSVTTVWLPLEYRSSYRQHINEGVWLGSNKTLFLDTEIWIS